jgi:predicted butyrate kinase (DUF1464 family)
VPRVIGIDPGTVSIDVCGLADGRVMLERSWPTAEVSADPSAFVAALSAAGPIDLIAGPSGYGLPLVPADRVSDADLRLAFLAPGGERGGIMGLRALVRALVAAGLPTVLLPGVIHLDTVPAHRKLNRVDLGTADKLCAAALGIHDQARRLGGRPRDAAFILLELGGAFTAALAVQDGTVVDGIGGTSGPIGWQAPGALDGEVAFLAGEVTKSLLFHGGVTTIAGGRPERMGVAFDAFVEGAAKAVRQLQTSAPLASEVLVSGRLGGDPAVRERLGDALRDVAPVRALTGYAGSAKQGAQGAALVADGLAGGAHAELVETLRLRHASGSVLDWLHVVTPAEARRRLGLDG